MQSATQQTPKTIQGPAIFLAQFLGPEAPFNSLEAIARWAGGLGYKGVQLPTLDERIFNLALAAESRDYCDEVTGTLQAAGLALTELSTHIQGQLVAVHPAYDLLFDGFAPEAVRGKPAARQEWAVGQLRLAARASANLGLKAHASFSGALAWPYLYPWPQRPPGLVETAFAELARRWRPILDAFEEAGTDVCFELHPGEDLHDGATFERFLEATGNHPRCNILYDPSHFLLQQMDYLGFIDAFHEPHPRLSCERRGIQPDGEKRRLWRFPILARPARTLPLAGRWADRFHRHLLPPYPLRLPRLGRAGMGMLPEGFPARCRRRRAVHRGAYYPSDRKGFR